MKYGCTHGDQYCPKARGVIYDVLASNSLEPCLGPHLGTGHPTQINTLRDLSKRKLIDSVRDNNFVSAATNDNEGALESLYRVSFRVSKSPLFLLFIFLQKAYLLSA
jgi:hypothetical protein